MWWEVQQQQSEIVKRRLAPTLFNIAASGRAPTRFPRLYARLERSLASLHTLFHTGGATEEERSLSFPCDVYVPLPHFCYYRAIDIDAPQEIVYRWLCQLRVAPYSYDWFDNFGRQSPRRLTPGLDRLSPGQRIFVMFRVVEFVESEQITMQGATPTYLGLFGPISLTYRIVPRSAIGCRVVSKLTGHYAGTFASRWREDFCTIGELPLMRKQLRTFKDLAEQQFLNELAHGRRLEGPVGTASGSEPDAGRGRAQRLSG
jgi:hypothetical protein